MLADVEKYRRHVDCFDLSDEEKVELIRALANRRRVCVDCACRLDSAPAEVPRHLSSGNPIDAPGEVTNGQVGSRSGLDLRPRLYR